MNQIDEDLQRAIAFDDLLEERRGRGVSTGVSLAFPERSKASVSTAPSDHCGRCGCERKYHNPPLTSNAELKSGGSSGKAYQKEVAARTCCFDCPHCFCFCTGFIEPFEGQLFKRCVYDRA